MASIGETAAARADVAVAGGVFPSAARVVVLLARVDVGLFAAGEQAGHCACIH